MVITVLSMMGCVGGPPPQMGASVRVEKLGEAKVQESSDFLAMLDSKQAVVLYPRVDGQVASIQVREGQQVSAGQVIMTLDATKQQAEYRVAQADAQANKSGIIQQEKLLEASKALRQSSVSNIELKQKELTRYQNLASKGAASKQELDRAVDALNKAKNDIAINDAQIQSQAAAVENARKRFQQSQAAVQQQQANLNYYVIRSPISGTVGDIPVKVGSYVNQNTLLTQVVQGQQLEIKLQLPVEKMSQVSLGQVVLLEDDKGAPLGEAQVGFISPSIDQSNQTFLIKAMVSNKGQFKVSQIVRAKVIWGEKAGLSVPPTAVLHAAGQDFVFVVTDAKGGKGKVAKKVPVKLGPLQNNRYIVISGLKAGDTLVKEGTQALQQMPDGSPVNIIADRTAEQENTKKSITEKDLKEVEERMNKKLGR